MSSNPCHPRRPLADLVPGDDAAVQGCLAWLEKLDRRVRELCYALKPALYADDLPAAARRVVLFRVEQEAKQCALTFGNRGYRKVVSESVAAWVRPMLDCGATACCRIIIAVQDNSLSVEELDRWLNQLLAPQVEVSRLLELLILAAFQRSGGKTLIPPAWMPGAENRTKTLSELAAPDVRVSDTSEQAVRKLAQAPTLPVDTPLTVGTVSKAQQVPRKRRRSARREAPATPRQLQAYEAVARHNGDKTAAATELRITRTAVDKLCKKVEKKFPDLVKNRLAAPRKRRLPTDNRGQETTTARDD